MSRPCPSEATSRRLALRATASARAFNRSGCSRRATSTSPAVSATWPGRPRRRAAGSGLRRPRRPAGAVCVDLSSCRSPAELAEDRGTLPWPEPGGVARGRTPEHALTARGVLRLEGSLLYLDRHWREEKQVCDDLLARLGRRATRDRGDAAGRCARAAVPGRAGRSSATPPSAPPGSGPPCSPAAPAPARPPRWPGCSPCWASSTRPRAAVRRGSRWPLRPARRPPGCRSRWPASATAGRCRRRTRPARRHRCQHGAPPARVASRQQHPVPAPPRQPAALRRRGRRRGLDGLAGPDGPAAGGGAATTRLVLVGDPDQLASVEAGAVLADLVAGFEGRADSPVVRLADRRTAPTADAGGARSTRWPRRSARGTPTRRSRCCARAGGRPAGRPGGRDGDGGVRAEVVGRVRSRSLSAALDRTTELVT